MPRVQGRIDQTNPLFSLDRFRANKRLMRSEMAKCVASEHTFSVYTKRRVSSVQKLRQLRYLYKNNEVFDLRGRSLYLKHSSSDRSLQVSGINTARCIPDWGQHATGYAGFHFRRAQIVQCGQPTTRSGQTSDITLDCKRTSRSERRPRISSASLKRESDEEWRGRDSR